MKKTKPKLKLDWATYEAAKYACHNWHYSRCLPAGLLIKIGVWEDGVFKGVLIYSRGANSTLGRPYGLTQKQSCELTRIALSNHRHEVSRMIAVSLKILKKMCDGLKLVISFADTEQGHHGGIYQASNWIYHGTTKQADEYIWRGKRYHGRSFRQKFGSHTNYINKGLKIVKGSAKHRYLMPLCSEIKSSLINLAQSYPERIEHESNAHDFQS